MEYLGPLQLWAATWIILAWYVATETKITPEVPNMLELRPFVLYFGNEESLRTTAYVFLRGFSKSTLEIHRLEATWDRLLLATLVSIFYSLIPGVTRALSGRKFWPSGILHFEAAVSAFITNLLLVFVLALVLQMQLMSGLQNYVEWMDDVTSLLDPEFAFLRQLPYLSFFRQSNALSWVEMRSYLYAKGLTIATRQEIFVGALVLIDMGLAAYLLYRLITEDFHNNLLLYQSETYNGILLLFLIIVYALLRIVRITGMIQRLQTKQKALLNNQVKKKKQKKKKKSIICVYIYVSKYMQKMKVYYRRVAKMEEEENSVETTDGAVNFEEIQNSQKNVFGSSHNAKTETNATLVSAVRDIMDGPGALENTEHFAASKIRNSEYLKKSESLIEHIMLTILTQDISPRIFNLPLQACVGLAVVSVFFSVLPTLIKSYVVIFFSFLKKDFILFIFLGEHKIKSEQNQNHDITKLKKNGLATLLKMYWSFSFFFFFCCVHLTFDRTRMYKKKLTRVAVTPNLLIMTFTSIKIKNDKYFK
ncbi:hypothetical protein RFI_03566 [Reticulomyxa filosa]|uniref:Uncharacterized protein n=1 Tax=Reticulomyxa filosa TaxID=46433 RepID=X6P5Q4_RETFI|nr:hypothetical protein RFI_03566 [Reticulomyxa filosa]|eukprot:ETO33536.1 hypothetical protein RFI_03566 [Reticulomyxa filosa]